MRTTPTAAIFTAWMAVAAQATPPQVVSVDDILLGANDTHIFLLRRLDDNMGGYTRTQTDILLVARNRSTNLDDEIWPVARSITDGPVDDPTPDDRVEVIATPGAVNPFDILAERDAVPMLGWSQAGTDVSDVTLAADGAQLVVEDTREKLRYLIDYADVGALLTDNLNRSRAAVPAYFTETDIDMLQDVPFDAAVDCAFAPSFRVTDGQGQIARLVAVTCENAATMVPISTYLVMPPAG
jgi:hypothetical protein